MKTPDETAAAKRAAILSELGRRQGHGGARYIPSGPWWVHAREIAPDRLIGRLLGPQIPGLGPKVVTGCAVARATGRHAELPVENEAVQLAGSGDRVRTFDAREGCSRKLVVRDSKYGRGLETDIEVRRELLATAGVPHPRVWTYAPDATHALVREELVAGRRFIPYIDRRIVWDALAEPLSRLYAAAGVREVPLSDYLGQPTAAQVVRLADGAGPLQHAKRLVERNPAITLAFGHGDLLPSNLAVNRSGVVFLDWETAGYAPVAFDLLRLWRKYPKVSALAQAARGLIARHQTGRIDLRDTASLALAIGSLRPITNRTRIAMRHWSALS
jgi:aminoglycoside phosphotransferase (APT) family kinase protein